MNKPSQGAMRAARRIEGSRGLTPMGVDNLATIIDEETHEAELLEALKEIDDWWSEDYNGPDDKNAIEFFHSQTIAAWRSMRAAIAKAEVTDGK